MSTRTSWVRRKPPTRDKRCYRVKADALKAFQEANRRVIDNYGGETYNQSPAEFDAINHKYGLKGRRKVRNIAEALWVAMPSDRPFCLDNIDLDALNDTSPAREAKRALGIQFELPDFAHKMPPRWRRMPSRKPPKNWQAKCATWKKAEAAEKRQLTDECFTDRYGNEKCVCRKGGRFVSCTPGGFVPGVPF